MSNLRLILCNKFISKVSESWIESEFRHKFDTNATVDDQPYCRRQIVYKPDIMFANTQVAIIYNLSFLSDKKTFEVRKEL